MGYQLDQYLSELLWLLSVAMFSKLSGSQASGYFEKKNINNLVVSTSPNNNLLSVEMSNNKTIYAKYGVRCLYYLAILT